MGPDNQDDERRITYFASTHTRGKREIFGIRAIDRGKHIYVIGKTGMGKSTMLENMAIQDIQNGEGIAYIDPHGSTAEKLLDFVPHERIKDVLYFAPFDTDHPIGFNVMEDVGYDKRHLVVSGLMGALKRIWVDAWSARMEYILQNTLLALLEYPGSTLLDVNRMLINKEFRKAVVEKINDPVVRAFWVEEFATYTDRYTQEATPAIQNKIGQFVANPLIRNIVGQPKSSFDMRKMMDEKKILIVNLSKGRMGETNASLLGSMLVVKIYLAAMSRADEPEARMVRLPRVYFYVDEFQSMMNEAFADILSESRKYKLALTLANQYIEQMEENVRNAVFGNIGTLICFRVGPFDAEVLKTVFEPTFMAEDLVGLGLGQIYLTLMIDGVGSAPFSAETIPPIETPDVSYREDVVNFSRTQFGKRREDVEAAVAARQAEFRPPPAPLKRERAEWQGDRGGKPPARDFVRSSGYDGRASPPPRDIGERRDRYEQSPKREPFSRDREEQRREHESSQGHAPFRGSVRREPVAPMRSVSPRPPESVRRESESAPRDEGEQGDNAEFANRDALRSAIQKAKSEPIRAHGEPHKSPADLLRERIKRDESVHKAAPPPQDQSGPKEVSPEVLRSILRDSKESER